MSANQGRVVVVIGAAGGIGWATARHLAAEGAVLVLADLDVRGLDVEGRLALPADVTRPHSLARLRDAAEGAFGRVDALINCAGVIFPGPLEGATDDEIRDQIEVNLLGTINASRAFLPLFRRQGFGHLVHVASLGGIVPLPHEAVYSATKFAVRGFVLALGLELRGGPVRATVVCPDSTDTAQLRAEALRAGSSLSFASAPLEPEAVARRIARALVRPRLEVSVPARRGWVAKLLGVSPRLLAFLYPLIDRMGRRRRAAFLLEAAPR